MNNELVKCGHESFLFQTREQWTDGANLFAIAPGVLLGYDRNEETIKALRARQQKYDYLNAMDHKKEIDKIAEDFRKKQDYRTTYHYRPAGIRAIACSRRAKMYDYATSKRPALNHSHVLALPLQIPVVITSQPADSFGLLHPYQIRSFLQTFRTAIWISSITAEAQNDRHATCSSRFMHAASLGEVAYR